MMRNTGNAVFSDVTASAFANANPKKGNVQDALSADLNGDGLLDLVTTSNDAVGNAFRATAPFQFVTYTTLPGGAGGISARGLSFGDVDRDGDLDMYLSDHGNLPHLFRNDGTSWTDITSALPVNQLFSSIQPYLADFNGDGNLDLLVTVMVVYINNAWPQGVTPRAHLVLGDGKGGFTDATDASHVGALAFVNCPIAIGDIDNDGDLDIFQIGQPYDTNTKSFVGNNTYPKLLQNDGHGVFTDVTSKTKGLPSSFAASTMYWEKGVIEDMDNDGWQDIVISRASPRLFRNVANLSFETKTPKGFDVDGYNTIASADLNSDGSMDLLAGTQGQSGNIHAWVNDLHDNNWLFVHVTAGNGNRDGIGSKIALYDAGHIDDPSFLRGVRQVIASSNDHTPYVQHFGASASGHYDVRVIGPRGEHGQRLGVATGQTIDITL
jgi:hypothetical protein